MRLDRRSNGEGRGLRGRDFTALETAVDHALESGREREALDLLVAERQAALERKDNARLAAINYLAHKIYERTPWTVAARAAQLLARPREL